MTKNSKNHLKGGKIRNEYIFFLFIQTLEWAYIDFNINFDESAIEKLLKNKKKSGKIPFNR